jgi:hypothetical protein
VKANDLDVRAVNLGADLKDGVLEARSRQLQLQRGELNGTARINATRDTPTASSICVWPAIRWNPSFPRATELRP